VGVWGKKHSRTSRVVERSGTHARDCLRCLLPPRYLARCILVAENWQWLSREQLAVFYTAITGKKSADGGSVYSEDRRSRLQAVRAILREQVRMLEEMVDLRWTDEAEARGFNVLLELLRDNRRTLGLSTGIANKPVAGSKRKAQVEAEAKPQEAGDEAAAKKQKNQQ
jgi:hypothetical protein